MTKLLHISIVHCHLSIHGAYTVEISFNLSNSVRVVRIPSISPPSHNTSEERPEAHQLNPLRYIDDNGDTQRIRILDRIGVQWFEVGRNLKIGGDHLDVIRESEQLARCASAMVTRWLRTGQDPTWEKLIEALEDSKLAGLAKDLKMALPRMKED